MASPSGSIVGTTFPIEDSNGGKYEVNSSGQLVYTPPPQVFNASSGTLNLVLYYSGNIYVLKKNGAWEQWQVPTYTISSGGGWTGISGDPRP